MSVNCIAFDDAILFLRGSCGVDEWQFLSTLLFAIDSCNNTHFPFMFAGFCKFLSLKRMGFDSVFPIFAETTEKNSVVGFILNIFFSFVAS